MDLRVIVVASDQGLAEIVRAQVENLGCACNEVPGAEEAMGALEWADAAVVDLAGDGLDQLRRLRTAAPELRVLAVAVDEDQAAAARELDAGVLVEPFAIPDLIQGVRRLAGPAGGGEGVIDLDAAARPAAADEDAPWWATR